MRRSLREETEVMAWPWGGENILVIPDPSPWTLGSPLLSPHPCFNGTGWTPGLLLSLTGKGIEKGLEVMSLPARNIVPSGLKRVFTTTPSLALHNPDGSAPISPRRKVRPGEEK